MDITVTSTSLDLNASVNTSTVTDVRQSANFSGPPQDDSDIDPASDAIWILTSTFIIFTMQSGFGLLESGSVTTKNEVSIMVKNAVDVIFGGLTYWLIGYGLSFGREEWNNPFCGWGNFLVTVRNENELGEVYSKFFFQASFSTTATTIVSGGMAERTKLEAYILFSLLNTLVYCFPAHWVWDDQGWLFQLGVIDIAGAGAVHLVGGMTALVASVMLKPRHGRFNSKYPPPMGSPTNAILGMFMLWWGWLGFNCGSTFGISGLKWQLAARAAVATLSASVGGGLAAIVIRSAICTLMASVAGGIVTCLTSYVTKARKFDVAMLINGVLGSLVGITAYCAMAKPWESCIIGIFGAVVALAGNALLEKLHVDDPVGAVGVHCFGGVWSLLVVGLFAKHDSLSNSLEIPVYKINGLFYGGGFELLGIQLAAAASISAWTLVVSFILLKIIDLTIGLRVPLQQEILGADLVEHAVGGIEYCKKTNTVKRYQRAMTANTELNGVDEENIPTFNEKRKRHSNAKAMGGLTALDMPNSVADVNFTLTSNGVHSGDGNHTNKNPPEKSEHYKMLWKYAAGMTLNEDMKKRRQNAKKNFSLIVKNRRVLGRTTTPRKSRTFFGKGTRRRRNKKDSVEIIDENTPQAVCDKTGAYAAQYVQGASLSNGQINKTFVSDCKCDNIEGDVISSRSPSPVAPHTGPSPPMGDCKLVDETLQVLPHQAHVQPVCGDEVASNIVATYI